MSINIPNALQAYGSVNGTTGAKVSGAGFTPARSAKGVYTLTMDQAADAAECAVLVTSRGATPAYASVEQTSDGVKTVNTVDAAGAAVDSDFDFLLLRAPA
jgi:hypothetical protein